MQLVGVGFHTEASVADVEIGDHLSVRAIRERTVASTA